MRILITTPVLGILPQAGTVEIDAGTEGELRGKFRSSPKSWHYSIRLDDGREVYVPCWATNIEPRILDHVKNKSGSESSEDGTLLSYMHSQRGRKVLLAIDDETLMWFGHAFEVHPVRVYGLMVMQTGVDPVTDKEIMLHSRQLNPHGPLDQGWVYEKVWVQEGRIYETEAEATEAAATINN